MVAEASQRGYTFPYLVDESQEIAKSYRAACTPDFFLFDNDFRLVYRGQFDRSRPSLETPVTGTDLRDASDAVYSLELPLRTYKFLVWVAISSGNLAMLQTGLDKKRRHRKF